MMSDEVTPTTLYVGNLAQTVSEELLCTLFSQIGPVNGCKVIREPGNDPYAFVNFANHSAASTALVAMNKRLFLDKEIKVNWASSPGNMPKLDTSNHHHIFVGDLSSEIDTKALKEAFAPFGEISNCRIVRDPQTLKSKGYAFVSFVNKSEAENAIATMNGQWLGNRCIRTNWSTRKPPPPRDVKTRQQPRPTYEEVYNQSSPTNRTVYCGGFVHRFDDDLIFNVFSKYGIIEDIKSFTDKGYAFIKFETKESAALAIENVHNTDINGQTVKCFWGKETPDMFQPVPDGYPVLQQWAPGVAFASNVGYWWTQDGQTQNFFPGYYPYDYFPQSVPSSSWMDPTQHQDSPHNQSPSHN